MVTFELEKNHARFQNISETRVYGKAYFKFDYM